MAQVSNLTVNLSFGAMPPPRQHTRLATHPHAKLELCPRCEHAIRASDIAEKFVLFPSVTRDGQVWLISDARVICRRCDHESWVRVAQRGPMLPMPELVDKEATWRV